MLRSLLHRFWSLLRRRAGDAELDAELQVHLDALTEENRRRGLSPEEARRALESALLIEEALVPASEILEAAKPRLRRTA